MKLIELDNAISVPLSNEEHEVFEKYVNTNIKENKDIEWEHSYITANNCEHVELSIM